MASGTLIVIGLALATFVLGLASVVLKTRSRGA
jgi:multisubunit Na+/H+ antiporter MnhC subunit